MLKIRVVLILCIVTELVFGQISKEIKVHSHNDYAQEFPFRTAFDTKVASIEIDVFLKDEVLYVTHAESEIKAGRDIEVLYLDPLKDAFAANFGDAQELQILIDFKSDAQKTLEQLIKTLKGYPSLVENDNISFVISGNRPPVEEYFDFPDYIFFDYQSLDEIEDAQIWKRIALISLPFAAYSKWDGESKISKKQYKALKAIVDKAHFYSKPFRFWGTPDTQLAWKTFAQMGVDYINTDRPAACSLYFKA